jgi:hypothetical protein
MAFLLVRLSHHYEELELDGTVKQQTARHRSWWYKTATYAISWLNIVDVLSIVPFYVSLAYANTGTAGELAILRVLRLTRVVRAFKIGKYTEGQMLFSRTLRASLPALVLFVFLTTIFTVVFGSLMYFFEMGEFSVEPDICPPSAYPFGCYLRKRDIGGGKEISPFSSILSECPLTPRPCMPCCLWDRLCARTLVQQAELILTCVARGVVQLGSTG